jgi:hypothetical protein
VFENDNLLWMLESQLASDQLGTIDEEVETVSANEESRLRAMSIADADGAADYMGRTRPIIIPEDLPDLTDSELAKQPDLVASLK